MKTAVNLATQIEDALLLAATTSLKTSSPQEKRKLAEACREMSERFLIGGRLLAFGRGPCSTDAQHVSVEFVHPVIVGKRALPALDLSALMQPWLDAICRPEDIVMGFGPPEGDPEVWSALDSAHSSRSDDLLLCLAPAVPTHCKHRCTTPSFTRNWSRSSTTRCGKPCMSSSSIANSGRTSAKANSFIPSSEPKKQETSSIVSEVADSILMKVRDDTALRRRLASEESEHIGATALAIHERLAQGGKLIIFGNGGSATDANDWAMDCVMPPEGRRTIPAISLSMEPANITALANDVGTEVIFARQLMAQARAEDIAIGISTSGGSRNIVMALEEARKRKLLTVALLGNDGGEIARRGLADFPIIVRSDYIPRIQEVQASAYHIILDTLEALSRGDA